MAEKERKKILSIKGNFSSLQNMIYSYEKRQDILSKPVTVTENVFFIYLFK